MKRDIFSKLISSIKHLFRHTHNENMLSIDYCAYISLLNNWNPAFKVILAVVLALFSISADSILISLIITFAMIWIVVVKGGISFIYYLKLMLIPIGFIMLSAVAIIFDFSKCPNEFFSIHIFSFYIYTTSSNLSQALLIIVKAIGAISCMYMMTLSTPSHEIIGVLKSMKVPSIVIELMTMIYRYIFILMNTQSYMTTSAKSRLGYRDIKTSYYSFACIAANLLIVSFKHASAYYDAMESRCYDGSISFLTEDKPLNTKHLAYAILFIIFLFIILLLVK